MHKKEPLRNKKPVIEDQVEDIYGVHFKYQDLFSRLLKVQKQRKMSEDKNPMPRMPSYDSNTIRQFSSSKGKKEPLLNKRSTSTMNLHQKTARRSVSVRKILVQHPVTDRKHDIFKSFSPSTKKPKQVSVHAKMVKKPEKKGSTGKITKKTLIKPKDLKNQE